MQIKKGNKFVAWVFLILWPFGAFIHSLFDIRSKTSAWVFIIFVTLFGFAFSFSNTGPDSYRYALGFHFSSFEKLDDVVHLYKSGELRDFYRSLLFVTISQFTKNPKVLFGVAGLIYGTIFYFSLRALKEFIGDYWDATILVLFVLFFALIPISGLNGFRYWTGALFLFYSLLNFFFYRKKRWIIGILITPLFHYSFIIVVPIIFLYNFMERFLYNDRKVANLLVLFFISGFLSTWILRTNTFQVGFLQQFIMLDAVNSRIDYITDSGELVERLELRRENSFFLTVRTYFEYGIRIFMFIIILYLYRLIKKINRKDLNRLMAFIFFFVTIGYLAKNIPSGGRFLTVFYVFVVFLMGRVYVLTKDNRLRNLIWVALPIFSFEFVFYNLYLPFDLTTHLLWWSGTPAILLDGYNFVFRIFN